MPQHRLVLDDDIQPGTITGSAIASGTITGSNVASNTLGNAQIGLASSASNSVTTAVTTTSTTAYSTVNSLSFTPAKTGKVLVIARLVVNNNTAGDGVSAELLNGSTVTLMALLTGLTVGTAYTLTTAIEAVTGGTASATGVMVALELLS